jgi:hypothetical protein
VNPRSFTFCWRLSDMEGSDSIISMFGLAFISSDPVKLDGL